MFKSLASVRLPTEKFGNEIVDCRTPVTCGNAKPMTDGCCVVLLYLKKWFRAKTENKEARRHDQNAFFLKLVSEFRCDAFALLIIYNTDGRATILVVNWALMRHESRIKYSRT